MDSAKFTNNGVLPHQILTTGSTWAYNKSINVLNSQTITNTDNGKSGFPGDSSNVQSNTAKMGMAALQVTGPVVERRGIITNESVTGEKPASNAQKPYSPSGDARELFEAADGLGTDEKAIFKALEGKTPEQVQKLKEHYKDHYGTSLDKMLNDELSGSDLNRARNLLKGNQESADADALHKAMAGIGTDEETVFEALEGKTPEQLEKIKQEYQSKYRVSLDRKLTSDMAGDDLVRAKALLNGNSAGADAARIHKGIAGAGTDEEAIYSAFEGKNPKQCKAIGEAYKKQYGVSLNSDLADDLSGPRLDRANALLDGNKPAADASKIRNAISGAGTNEEEVWSTLNNTSAEHRQAISNEYHKLYGVDITDDIRKDFGGNDLKKSNILLEQGKLSDAEKVHFAVDRWGTDEETVREALSDKSKDEIASMRQEYAEKFNGSLDNTVKDDLSGRDLFDAHWNLKGNPETAGESMERMDAYYRYERGDSSDFSRSFVDMLSDSGKVMDRNYSRAKDHYTKAYTEGTINTTEQKRSMELSGFVTDDARSYRKAKDSAADTAGNVSAFVVGTAVGAATGGLGTPLSMLIMSASTGAAKLGGTYLVRDNTYSLSEGAKDFTMAAVGGATSVMGGNAGKFITGQIFKNPAIAGMKAYATKKVISQGVSKTLNDSVSPVVDYATG